MIYIVLCFFCCHISSVLSSLGQRQGFRHLCVNTPPTFPSTHFQLLNGKHSVTIELLEEAYTAFNTLSDVTRWRVLSWNISTHKPYDTSGDRCVWGWCESDSHCLLGLMKGSPCMVSVESECCLLKRSSVLTIAERTVTSVGRFYYFPHCSKDLLYQRQFLQQPSICVLLGASQDGQVFGISWEALLCVHVSLNSRELSHQHLISPKHYSLSSYNVYSKVKVNL